MKVKITADNRFELQAESDSDKVVLYGFSKMGKAICYLIDAEGKKLDVLFSIESKK